jgi:23S rRNA (uracil1939-C5)-methyltransferase
MKEKNIPFKPKENIELTITGLGSSGEGVGKLSGFTFFVPGALPGERVQAQVTVLKKNYGQARLSKLLVPSPDRITPPCPVYAQCGGCQLQHLSYPAQLALKRQTVVDAMERIGHFKNLAVLETLGAPDPWHYRNKMQVPAAQGRNHTLHIGCYAQGTHRIIDVDDCLIQQQANNQIVHVVRRWMEQYRIPALEEDARRGIVRHIMGRVGVRTGEVMAVLVTNEPQVPHLKNLVSMLKKDVPGFVTLVQNLNTRHTNVILGPKNKIIYGPGIIHDRLGDFTFSISPLSFFQVNTLQAEKLYETALQYAALTGQENVIDAYCGTGTITLFLSRKARRALGIEIVAPAIRDARQNARDNHIQNVDFLCGDAAREMPELVKNGSRPDVVVLDPPRAGCEQRVLDAIAKVRPHRVVYVSCNPASLARDAAILRDRGFVVRKVQPVDMFPHTSHVESVALLTYAR